MYYYNGYWRSPTLEMETFEEFFGWLWSNIRSFDYDKLSLAIARRGLDRLFPYMFAVKPFHMKTMKRFYFTVLCYHEFEKKKTFLDKYVSFDVKDPNDHPLIVVAKVCSNRYLASVFFHSKCQTSAIPWKSYLFARYNAFVDKCGFFGEENNLNWFQDSYFDKVPIHEIEAFLNIVETYKKNVKPWLIGKLKELVSTHQFFDKWSGYIRELTMK